MPWFACCRFPALPPAPGCGKPLFLRGVPRRVGFRRLPVWQRLLVAAVLLPFVLAGGASGAYYLRLHRITGALSLAGLPIAPAPAAARRILVLSPHCDDETLGVGGLIADARRAGAAVTVAFLTNGDGFPLATGRALRDVRLSPADYIRFAERRQTESVAALGELGVGADHVLFLGYPDRGLDRLWQEHWAWDQPFRSRYTERARSPYARAYTPGAVHCGASLFGDLSRLLQATRPTDIYVTHPADDHPDHAAAAAFTQAALLSARDRGETWARAARLHYYLIHRGNWPLPQGLRPDKPLLPPAGLLALDTDWQVYPLSPAAQAAKARALARYGSQMAVMRRFLSSFVRPNELYGRMPDLCAGGAREGRVWQAAPTAPDATRDDVVRYAGPSADLRGLSICQSGQTLRVRVTTRGPVSPRVRYTLLLRVTGDGALGDAASGATRFLALNLPAGKVRSGGAPGAGETVRAQGDTIEAIMPLAALGLASAPPRHVWVAVQTHWARVPVDQTGFRAFTLMRERAPRTMARQHLDAARKHRVENIATRNRRPNDVKGGGSGSAGRSWRAAPASGRRCSWCWSARWTCTPRSGGSSTTPWRRTASRPHLPGAPAGLRAGEIAVVPARARPRPAAGPASPPLHHLAPARHPRRLRGHLPRRRQVSRDQGKRARLVVYPRQSRSQEFQRC